MAVNVAGSDGVMGVGAVEEEDTRTATAASENESGDEVDVVSVPTSPRLRLQAVARPEMIAASRPVSLVRDLLVLPPACSLLARVTAMHNYSSCSGQRTASSASSSSPPASSRDIYSAPQSPSASPDVPAPRHRLDRRCFSTPASPSPVLHSPTSAAVRRSNRRRAVRRRPRPTAPSWDSSASDDSDSGASTGHATGHHGGGHPGCGKRAHHNVLERRRRDHLKYSFEALRAVVQGAAGDVRMPKVAILRRARDHVRQLTTASQKLYDEYSRLMGLHQRLRQRLASLTNDDDQLSQPDADQTVCSGGTFLGQAAA